MTNIDFPFLKHADRAQELRRMFAPPSDLEKPREEEILPTLLEQLLADAEKRYTFDERREPEVIPGPGIGGLGFRVQLEKKYFTEYKPGFTAADLEHILKAVGAQPPVQSAAEAVPDSPRKPVLSSAVHLRVSGRRRELPRDSPQQGSGSEVFTRRIHVEGTLSLLSCVS